LHKLFCIQKIKIDFFPAPYTKSVEDGSIRLETKRWKGQREGGREGGKDGEREGERKTF
jgi:hypothetical protein